MNDIVSFDNNTKMKLNNIIINQPQITNKYRSRSLSLPNFNIELI